MYVGNTCAGDCNGLSRKPLDYCAETQPGRLPPVLPEPRFTLGGYPRSYVGTLSRRRSNLEGRILPKRKPIQDELEKVFEENPELARKIVYKAAIKAAKGDHKFFCEIRDMMDGKLAAPLFGAESDSMSVTLDIEVVRKKLFGDDEKQE
jgi:hypothetical protein